MTKGVVGCLLEFSKDYMPVKSIDDVPELIMVLRAQGENKVATKIEGWKGRMDERIRCEFSEPTEVI